jgi:hypothetical protein
VRETQFLASGSQPCQPELGGETDKRNRLLTQTEQTAHDRMHRRAERRVGTGAGEQELPSRDQRIGAQIQANQDGKGVDAGDQGEDALIDAFGHTDRIATEGPHEMGPRVGRRQFDRKPRRPRCGQRAVGGGRDSLGTPEVFVKDGERLKPGVEGEVGEFGARGGQAHFGPGQPAAQDQLRRGEVEVLPAEFKEPRRAETGAFHQRGHIGKPGGALPDFRREGFHVFPHRIGAAGIVVGVAFPTGPQPRGAGGFAGRIKVNVLRLRFAGLAGRQTVDAGGAHSGEELPVVGRVSGHEAGVHVGVAEAHRDVLYAAEAVLSSG